MNDVSTNNSEAALQYVSQGFSVIPLCWPGSDGSCACGRNHQGKLIGKVPLTEHGLNDATQTLGGVREYWRKWPYANIGLLTKKLIVLDLDVKSGGLNSKNQLIAINGELPRTRVHKTGGGGEHWLYLAPEGSDYRGGAGKYGYPGVDIRANGGYIVAPCSLHASGERYEVIDNTSIAPAPAWLLELIPIKTSISITTQSGTGHPITMPEGQRNVTLTSLAGSMQRRGMAEQAIVAALKSENQFCCSPPLADEEVERIACSISRYDPPTPITPRTSFNLTDTGNAELLVNLYGDKLRYDHKRTRWLIWNGNIWQPDTTGAIYRLVIEVARERYRKALSVENLTERAAVSRWAIGSENRSRIESASSIAQNLLPVADSGDNWDSDKWLLGCENGVIDLKKGELRPGRQADQITMTTDIAFDPAAKCERWQQFLDEIFNGDEELIDWVWRFAGYALTGDTSEQIVVLGYGTGSNGKGKFNHALRQAMGDYAHDAPFSTFELSAHSSTIPNDLATLERRRFVTSSETNDGTRLNEARIKAISGEDPVTARYLHHEFFTFQPACKICLFVNHKPRVEDDSLGFWRRVRLVPFTRQFSGSNDDKGLGNKLDSEAPGILAWLVRGCLAWQDRGLSQIPEAITTATEEYKVESDPLGQFIAEMCVETPLAVTKSSELYKTYVKWAEDLNLRGRELLTLTAFGRRMKVKYQKVVQRDATYYRGIGLKSCGEFT